MRIASPEDLEAIVAIYNSTIDGRQSTADTEHVSVESRREWFRRHNDFRPIYVHEADGRVVGWVSFESFYGRPAYKHTAEISIYVSEAYRGQGLGRQLLCEGLELCPELGIKTVLAYIFSHNAPSLRLFRSEGFRSWGELPGIAEMDGIEYSLSILGRRIY